MSTTVFRADVDLQTWHEAVAVLADDGLTVSDAFRRMLNYIVVERRVPSFDCFVPNAGTLAAMSSAEQGDLITVGSVTDLIADLNNDEDD